MTKTWVIADTHFGHKNVITFKDSNGEIIRKFNTIEEHDDHIRNNWNRLVDSSDTVYHLGDVVINRRSLPILDILNGRKVLIKGNHDIFKLRDYVKYFEDIRAYKVLPEHKIIMSHIPIHPQCLDRWNLNIHGHLHHNKILSNPEMDCFLTPCIPDPKYLCVSVDQTDFKPVLLDDIIKPYLSNKQFRTGYVDSSEMKGELM